MLLVSYDHTAANTNYNATDQYVQLTTEFMRIRKRHFCGYHDGKNKQTKNTLQARE